MGPHTDRQLIILPNQLRGTSRTAMVLLYALVILGPFGLFPAAVHNHSHPGPDTHCAACVLVHSGVMLIASVTLPPSGDRLWEPLAPAPAPLCTSPADFSFLSRAPPAAS